MLDELSDQFAHVAVSNRERSVMLAGWEQQPQRAVVAGDFGSLKSESVHDRSLSSDVKTRVSSSSSF